jgi:glyoxylate/hydroxypyruvate/2-ketogluconate reductase
MSKPSILITRTVPAEVVARLMRHFEVQTNPDDAIWTREELIAKLQGKQGVFTSGGERIDAALLAACPELKIDVDAMTAAGVQASNAPDVLTETTADMAFALLMATARRVSEAEAYLRAGLWKKMSFDMLLGADIHGATLGILGMGRIGQAIARRGAHGFGMRVIYHNRSQLDGVTETSVNARYVSKEDLFKQADHIVLVVPYSPASHHTVAAAEIALMKPTATIVNIGRGGLIDEDALALALAANKILGAGLDVFEGEPKVNPALLTLKNVVLTPHIGSASVPTRKAMANLAADNLIGYLIHGKAVTPLNKLTD